MSPATHGLPKLLLAPFGLLALFSLLGLSACDGNDGASSEVEAEDTIGSQGGTLSVREGTLAGTSITFPPGALAGPTLIQLRTDQISIVPGLVAVGPAARIEPSGLELLQPSVLVLPFDPELVPDAVTAADFTVQLRQADGRQQQLLPRQVDQGLGRVMLDVLQLGTYWVAVPDVVRIADYLPLRDGSRYDYDNGVQLSIADTQSEPNFLGIALHKLQFSRAGAFLGFYFLDDPDAAIRLAGEFEIAIDNRQERLDGGALLLDPIVTVQAERQTFYSFVGFRPYGSQLSSYLGTAEAFSTIVERTALVVPAGSYDDVVVWEWFTVGSDSRPQARQRLLRIWLARGTGPVQIQLDSLPPFRLVSTNVGS